MQSSKKLTPAVSKEDHIEGSPSARIVLVEYGDYQCPYCGAAYPIVKELQRHFGKDLCLVFRNFPLLQVHQFALGAAVAAEAANLQGKFWPMHDMLFENQQNLELEDLQSYADKLGLDLEKFDLDFKSDRAINKVRTDLISADKNNLDGTPSFFVNDMKYAGSADFDSMKSFIEQIKKDSSSISARF